MLFAGEGGRVGDAGAATARRVRAAAAAGLPAVEIWGWRGKDADALGRALNDTGTPLQTVCVDPMVPLAGPADRGAFLAAVRESADGAEWWGCPYLVVTAGQRLPGVPLPAQRAAVEEALRAAGRLLSAARSRCCWRTSTPGWATGHAARRHRRLPRRRVDWRAAALGYTGRIGLEYAPTVATPASLAVIRALAAEG
jgi:hydroxypyruvate isomerase